MVIANRCMHWEDGIVKLKSQLTNAMDANKTSSSTAAELTREKNLLTDELTRVGIESLMKDEELRRTTESYGKALDQLKALSEQLEPARLKSISHPMLVMTTIPSISERVSSFRERRPRRNTLTWIFTSSNHMKMMILLPRWRRGMKRWRQLILN
jgi:hypothetical protein